MKPIISKPGEGPVFTFEPASLVRFKVTYEETGGTFEVFERELPPQTLGADAHLHATTTESLYVIEGRATILCGESWAEYDAGTMIVVPPHTPHGFLNDSDAAVRLLISFVPALGHETFFAELARLKRGPTESFARDLAAVRQRFDTQSVTGCDYVFRARRAPGAA
ncbi:cupin domain-containing protein [Acidisoma sp. 7E03]